MPNGFAPMHAFQKQLLACGSFMLTVIFSAASGAPVFYAGTGHWYEAVKVPAGLTWGEAYTNAINRGGYLCTIADSNENAFAASLVDVSDYSDISINHDILGPWLGGLRHAGESTWHWVTGESFTYTDWYPGQPDGYGGSEQRLQFYAGASVGATWGDHPGDPIPGYSLPRGYIVEYDQYPQLSIARSNEVVTVSWPLAFGGWTLESTPTLSLNPIVWTPVPTNGFQTNASGIFITITNRTPGIIFYRLRQP